MAEYVKRFGGYIADVPKVYLKRCLDNKTFVLDEITQASVTPNVNTIEINAGWSLFPVAVLAGQSTFEMQITSAKFEADLFSYTNNKRGWENNQSFEVPGTVYEKVVSTTIVLPHLAQQSSIEIEGLTEVNTEGTPASGTFKVSTQNNADNTQVSKITFNQDMNGRQVRINYIYAADADYINIDNKMSAICEAVLEFPVYDDGNDCANSDVTVGTEIGHVYVKVFKARVSQLPGMDGSYKSASTFQFTLAALDPKRSDEAVYQIYYVEK